MPLSLVAIGSMLKAHGVNVTVIDGQIVPEWRAKLLHEISTACYLGVSALTGPSITPVLEAIELARSEQPALPVVWGGYHAFLAFRSILTEGLADYVVLGPGEYAALSLVRALMERDPAERELQFNRLENVACIRGGNLQVTRSRTVVDPNELPPLDYSLIDVPSYFRATPKALQYVSSYGCPYACTFCAEPSQTNRKWRGLSPDRMVREIDALWMQYKPDRINIIDPNFSSSAARVVRFVQELILSGVRIEICCDMRATDILRIANLVDLVQLREAGFREIYIGVELGSDRLLKLLRKSMTACEAYDACKALDGSE